MSNWLAIFIGGGAGSLLRYAISRWTLTFWKNDFPMGTLISNLLSCLLLVLFIWWLESKSLMNSPLKFLLMVGFCGGFSTFSTFSYETLLLIRNDNWGFAILNVLLSIIAALVLLWLMFKFLNK